MSSQQIDSLRAARERTRERTMTPAQAAMSRRLNEAEKISATKAAEAATAAAYATVAAEASSMASKALENLPVEISPAALLAKCLAGNGGDPVRANERVRIDTLTRVHCRTNAESWQRQSAAAAAAAEAATQAAAAAAAEVKSLKAEYEVLAEVERRLKAEADAAQKKRMMELAIEREAKKRLEEAEFEAAVQVKMAAMRVAQ